MRTPVGRRWRGSTVFSLMVDLHDGVDADRNWPTPFRVMRSPRAFRAML